MSERHDKPAITVLFVDDEPVLLRSILRALRKSPFDVLGADSADDALTTLRQHQVDVLVSDIDMPGMNGLELLKVARREFPGTFRMLFTGAGTMARTVEAINEGEVCRFFVKPLDLDLFQATMVGLVDRIAKLRREGDAEAHAARVSEFLRWVEASYPGTLGVTRTEAGEIEVNPPAEDLALLDSSQAQRPPAQTPPPLPSLPAQDIGDPWKALAMLRRRRAHRSR